MKVKVRVLTWTERTLGNLIENKHWKWYIVINQYILIISQRNWQDMINILTWRHNIAPGCTHLLGKIDMAYIIITNILLSPPSTPIHPILKAPRHFIHICDCDALWLYIIFKAWHDHKVGSKVWKIRTKYVSRLTEIISIECRSNSSMFRLTQCRATTNSFDCNKYIGT